MELSADEAKSLGSKLTQGFRHWQFGTKKQLAFLEDLYLLINDGIPANRAIEMMGQVSTGLGREVAFSLSQKIAQGQPLADGMSEWFSPNVVEIIRVGEAGGALAQTLKSAINMLSQQGVAIGAFIGAVAYPLLVIVVGCIMMIYLRRVVFTEFEKIKPLAQWPDAGKTFINVAEGIQHWWWLFILIVFAIIFAFRWVMKNYIGEYRTQLDRYPPFSFYRRFAAARLLETLGLLVANGIVFKSAIKVMQRQANPYMSYHLAMMEHLLSMGKTNIADVLDTGLVDEQDLVRLRVMAEVRGFEHGLIRMGVRGTEQATATLKIISRMFGGILLMMAAYLILIIIQGIYMTGMAMGG